MLVADVTLRLPLRVLVVDVRRLGRFLRTFPGGRYLPVDAVEFLELDLAGLLEIANGRTASLGADLCQILRDRCPVAAQVLCNLALRPALDIQISDLAVAFDDCQPLTSAGRHYRIPPQSVAHRSTGFLCDYCPEGFGADTGKIVTHLEPRQASSNSDSGLASCNRWTIPPLKRMRIRTEVKKPSFLGTCHKRRVHDIAGKRPEYTASTPTLTEMGLLRPKLLPQKVNLLQLAT